MTNVEREYTIRVAEVVDGATVIADVDLGFGTRTEVELWLSGVAVPLEDDAAQRALDTLVHLVSAYADYDAWGHGTLRAQVTKVPTKKRAYTARLLGTREDGTEIELNRAMVDLGKATAT